MSAARAIAVAALAVARERAELIGRMRRAFLAGTWATWGDALSVPLR